MVVLIIGIATKYDNRKELSFHVNREKKNERMEKWEGCGRKSADRSVTSSSKNVEEKISYKNVFK